MKNINHNNQQIITKAAKKKSQHSLVIGSISLILLTILLRLI